ncbi:MAG: TM2 domain-containing protein [Acidiferrobacteraceae bacterium]
MAKAWKKWNLEGGGLQSTNLALARGRKHRFLAYLLWPLFPAGVHALYLAAYLRAAGFVSAGIAMLALFATGHHVAAATAFGITFLFACYDLFWIDRRVVDLNKQLRLTLSLRPGHGAPATFSGHYRDDNLDTYLKEKERERAGHSPLEIRGATDVRKDRPPSFSEQEAQLQKQTVDKKPE